MRLHCNFIACFVLFALCSLASPQFSQDPNRCCFSFSKVRIPSKQIVSYHTTHLECHTSGIIFIIKSQKEICADPNERWVRRLKNLVDARNLRETSEDITMRWQISLPESRQRWAPDSRASTGFSQGPDKCCFSFSNLKIPVKQIESYHITHLECHRSGIIFITKGSKEFCADLNERWALRLKNLVDARTLRETAEDNTGDSA